MNCQKLKYEIKFFIQKNTTKGVCPQQPSRDEGYYWPSTNTLFGIYYPISNLFIIKSLNIVSTFDNCMSLELDLVPCIKVMKSKWFDYYLNIPNTYLLGIIFLIV